MKKVSRYLIAKNWVIFFVIYCLSYSVTKINPNWPKHLANLNMDTDYLCCENLLETIYI